MKPEFLDSFAKEHPERVLYFYDLDGILNRLKKMKTELTDDYHIHFAMKSNHNRQILSSLATAGASVDVVSLGEMELAISCGFRADQVVFSGVGKSKSEIRESLKLGVGQLNVESSAELERVAKIAKELGKKARVALRVNPDVEAKTHPYIRTGLKENKFGIEFTEAEKLVQDFASHPHLEILGLSLHIGSQIRETKPFLESVEKTMIQIEKWQEACPSLKSLDVGGGLGIDYHSADLAADEDLFCEYAKELRKVLDPAIKSGLLKKVLLEPGRFLVARFGTLFCQVEYIKKSEAKRFVIVNTGMHHLLRPSLYQAYHRIDHLDSPESSRAMESFDVVGPICESSDVLGRDRVFSAEIKEGDWMAIRDVGAYGQVMASDYNLQPKAIEKVFSEGRFL